MGRVGKAQVPGQTDLSPNEDTFLLARGLGLLHPSPSPASPPVKGVMSTWEGWGG